MGATPGSNGKFRGAPARHRNPTFGGVMVGCQAFIYQWRVHINTYMDPKTSSLIFFLASIDVIFLSCKQNNQILSKSAQLHTMYVWTNHPSLTTYQCNKKTHTGEEKWRSSRTNKRQRRNIASRLYLLLYHANLLSNVPSSISHKPGAAFQWTSSHREIANIHKYPQSQNRTQYVQQNNCQSLLRYEVLEVLIGLALLEEGTDACASNKRDVPRNMSRHFE